MRRMVLILALLGLMGVSVSARAQVNDTHGWTNCQGTKLATQYTSTLPNVALVSEGRTLCYEWENQTATSDSTIFFVSGRARILCNMNIASTNPPVGGGQVTPRMCPSYNNNTDKTPALATATNCIGMGVLDGTEGDAATQKASVRVEEGWYYLDLTTTVPDTHFAKCSIIGETR